MSRKPSDKRATRRVKLTREMVNALQEQRRLFVEKFGREPGPQDPVFFDPHATEPVPFSMATQAACDAALVEAMRATGIDPAKIYAFRKTGLLLTARNYRLASPEDRRAWAQAVDEFESPRRAGH